MPSSRLPWEPPLPAGEKPLSVWWHLPQRQAWRGPRLRERSHVPPDSLWCSPGLGLPCPAPGLAASRSVLLPGLSWASEPPGWFSWWQGQHGLSLLSACS